MKIESFHIGLEFVCGPFRYRCTDVGTRTVVAIPLIERDPKWYQGPPYMLQECVLDEMQLQDAYPSEEALLTKRIKEADSAAHPGYSGDAVVKMLKAKVDREYPSRRRILKFDRVRADGEILHPYAARKDPARPNEWLIKVFLPFTEQWEEIPEDAFFALPLSTPADIQARAARNA